MATATRALPINPPVTLVLSGEEAQALFNILNVSAKLRDLPADTEKHSSAIWRAMYDLGIRTTRA